MFTPGWSSEEDSKGKLRDLKAKGEKRRKTRMKV